MSKSEEPVVILHNTVRDIRNLKNIVDDTNNIISTLQEIDTKDIKAVDGVFEETQKIVCRLRDSVSTIDKYFTEHHDLWKSRKKNCEKKLGCVKVVLENVVDKKNNGCVSDLDDNDADNSEDNANVSLNENERSVGEETGANSTDSDASLKEKDSGANKEKETDTDEVSGNKSPASITASNEETFLNESVQSAKSNNVNGSESTSTSLEGERDLLKSKPTDGNAEEVQVNGTKKVDETSDSPHKETNEKDDKKQKEPANSRIGLIKVIDINRLIDPNKVALNRNNNRNSDSDVVIISDTEEAPAVKKPARRPMKPTRNNKKKRNASSSDESNRNAKGRSLRKDTKLKVKSAFNVLREKRKTMKKSVYVETSSSSETSSLSDSDFSISSTSKSANSKKQQSNKRAAVQSDKPKDAMELCNAQNDKKLGWKAYVRLQAVPSDKLKEFYLKNKENDEIDRLCNLNSLKRTRNRKDSKTSTDSDGVKRDKKRSRITGKDKKVDDNAASGSSSDAVDIPDNINEKSDESPVTAQANDKSDTEANLQCVNESSKSSDNDSDKEKSSDKDGSKNDDDKKETKSKKKSKNDDKEDKSKENESDDNDNSEDKRKKKWRNDPLLKNTLTDSDSDEQLKKYNKKKDKTSSDTEDVVVKVKRKRLKKSNVIDSNSDYEQEGSDDKKSSDSSSSSSNSKNKSSDSEKEAKKKKKTTRRRIKRVESSSDDENDKTTRKQIRKVIANSSLSETTQIAQKEEAERKARIAERQKKYNSICDADYQIDAKIDEVVLDFDEETKKTLLKVHPKIVKHLKPHQAAGIQFMWNACFESIKRATETTGSGCILAHCMGLGKTLQVIALCHTLLSNSDKTGINKILVVCPLNTVLNWVAEFKQWLPKDHDIELFELNSFKQNYERKYQAEEWHRCGGVFIIGYDMFRNLSNKDNKRLNKKLRESFSKTLVDPGPDLVICDEGHLLKNEKTSLSIAMNRLKTLRRIVLTGTPLQNNLKEYWCMVQFVKPNLLGTYREYLNRFVNPITNGQYTDSTLHDIHVMRKRSHVLHKLLDGVVQRRDYSVLAPYLAPKFEYVLFLTLTEVQIKLYSHYMNEYARSPKEGERLGQTSFLFADFQEFQRICTHPRVLLDKSIEDRNARDRKGFDSEEESEGSLKDFINDDEKEKSTSTSDSSSENSKSDGDEDAGSDKSAKVQTVRLTRANAALAGGIEEVALDDTHEETPSWWREYCDGDELDNLNHGIKLFVLLEILKQCELIGDKLLVFSQSLYALNIIEYFLTKIDEATQSGSAFCGHTGSWARGLDYFRLDGSSSSENRSASCKTFNDEENTRARLFLISTRAGGLGINLVAANRVVIFDVSWNPSHDIQSIYRVYRFGQKKPCYVYRFVTLGTMEMKIYERQVTKQAISKRVIDEQQIDRHYNQNDLAELYKFDPKPTDRPTPLVPKDVLLAELLQNLQDQIFSYHEHQSLLENKEDEVLNEEERKAAWEEFEQEKTARQQEPIFMNNSNFLVGLPAPAIATAFSSMLKRSNPDLTPRQINNIMPSLFNQLKVQVENGMTSLYDKIYSEFVMMGRISNDNNFQILCDMMVKNRPVPRTVINPLAQYIQSNPNFAIGGSVNPSTSTLRPPIQSNEIIDLNDE